MNRISLCLALVTLALPACQRTVDEQADIAFEEANRVTVAGNGSAAAATGGEASGPGFEVTSSKDGDTSAGMPILPQDLAKTEIPAQYRGRWGMVPADCTSTRGDAKGLITIDARTIRFYESLATLKAQRPAIATSFAGLYAFSGEGQSWEKVVTLTRTDGHLTRADDEGSFEYRRCA
jgi:hypothetical protein